MPPQLDIHGYNDVWWMYYDNEIVYLCCIFKETDTCYTQAGTLKPPD